MGSLYTTMRHHLVDYLAGTESYEDFTSWLYRALWNIQQQGDSDASDLGYSIILALTEYESGILTVDEMNTALRVLAQDAGRLSRPMSARSA